MVETLQRQETKKNHQKLTLCCIQIMIVLKGLIEDTYLHRIYDAKTLE